LREWPRDPSGAAPRRAGVSSLGIGGTNAHVVLEEAPAQAPLAAQDGGTAQLLVLSARTATALERRASDLAAHIEACPGLPLADIAWTLQTGRQVFQHRRAVAARTAGEAVAALRAGAKLARVEERLDTPVAFLFPGQGTQYPGMGAGLYKSELVFRGAVDQCAEILRGEIGCDLREVIFATGEEAEARLRETRFTQPAIFTIGCALGKLWLSRGLRPAAMLGHSVGEFVAATLAGVFSLEEAARLVATRARLVQALPHGAMLAARLGESEARELLTDPRVDIAACNSPKLSVFAGPFDAIAALEEKLREGSVPARRLSTSHAFHSPMVEPALPEFAKAVAAVALREPALPIVSSVTGDWMTGAEATDPQYWTLHMRRAVRFSDAAARLFDIRNIALIEAGPGQTLGQLARQSPRKAGKPEIAHSIEEGADEDETLAAGLGRLWLAGVPVDWAAIHGGVARRHVSLPGYPFERQRYFADLPPGVPMPITTAATDGEAPIDDAMAAAVVPGGSRESVPFQASIPAESESTGDETLAQLRQLLVHLSGLDLAAVPATNSLLELGFDSLFLSQIALAISRKFGVKITVRQLLRDLGTMEALAAHLARERPPSAGAPKPLPPEAAERPAAVPAPAGSNGAFQPVRRDLRDTLTAPQRSWLENFITRFNGRTALPAPHDDDEIARIVSAFAESAAEFEAAAFFPRRVPEPVAAAPAGPVPLTESQRELWLLCQQSPAANSACNITWTLHLHGELDVAALRKAIQEIVNRHDALRCAFDPSGESLTVAPALTLEVPCTDLSALPEEEAGERLAGMRSAESLRLFDPARGPLLALQIVKVAAERHALIFTAHHLVCDGWSCDVFLNELAAIYSAGREGRPLTLPAAMQMRDYQRWEEEMRNSPEFAAERQFWREQYQAPPPVLELPGDRPHPARRSYRGANEIMTLPPEFPQALVKLGARNGATLFTVLLAAYKTLLFRLSGQGDLTVGIPSAGQNSAPGSERLMGDCVNMLPLRSRLEGGQSFESLLGALQAGALEAFEHPNVTFGSLLQDIGLERIPGRIPLIPVTFNVDPPLSHIRFAGLTHRLEPNPRTTFQFDFCISCDATADHFRLVCSYNTDLFDAATVRRWLNHYRVLLEEVASDPARPLALLPLLDGADRRKMLEWSESRIDFPGDALLHTLFEAQAERTPGAVAVVFGEDHLTYAGLNSRANQLAHRLRKLGIGPDVLAGVCMERSLEMVVALLAVLKAGGAYVPLDPAYPRERIGLMIADAGMPVILAQSRFAELCGGAGSRLVCVDAEDFDGETAANPGVAMSAGDLAYVIYTSGSTGRPKGVMIPHSAICNYMLWMQAAFPVGGRDRLLQQTSISFDASVWEFFLPLVTGGQLVMAQPDGHRDSRYLAEAVVRHGITTLQLVPSMARMFVEEPGLEACAGSLRRLFCGGEALTPEVCEKFFARLGGCELINLYGPTECAIDATFHTCVPGAKIVPIGGPLANTRLYILDANLQPVPPGVPGELYVGGAQLARGYWRNPELTAAAFPSYNGERVYKTGDLTRWLPGGEVEYLGRADHQVKIRGFRIEPGEIEGALERQPGVAESAVVVREDTSGEKRLVAYVVRERRAGEGGAPLPDRAFEEALLSELKNTMPDYMVPAAIVFLPSFPRTPNGKLDRRALPAPEHPAREEESGEFPTPGTVLEQRLAELWQDVLCIERVGLHDNFLALGGQSLLALRIVNRLREMLRENVSLAVMFDSPTVSQLAGTLGKNYPEAVAAFIGEATKSVPPPEAQEAEAHANGAGQAGKQERGSIPRLSRSLRAAGSVFENAE
jgi:amino acid adenylation domain-containing protein